jgi:NAD(P)-dependent dehydrogenase (short-subunit alcohol dehydrogenase family)
MGALDGRIAIITGAGRGLGREHALLFAQEGAKVVVNDLGGDMHGEGADRAPAQQVVDEIEKMGGEAVANLDSAADWDGAQRLIRTAIDTFGDLHVLVNNAGILRDRVIVNMTEEEWDAVIHVHLKGHFVPTRWAAAYWREQTKAGKVSIVHTSSTSGLGATRGRPTTAAKSGIATFRTSRRSSWAGMASARTIAPAARTPHRADARAQEAVKAPGRKQV